jgi:hypothetical protein
MQFILATRFFLPVLPLASMDRQPLTDGNAHSSQNVAARYGKITVVCPNNPARPRELDIRRGAGRFLGNPFRMRAKSERPAVCAAYAKLLYTARPGAGRFLGNPFRMRAQSERPAVCAAYAKLLYTARPVRELARDFSPPLEVHDQTAAVRPCDREAALHHILHLVRAGHHVRLRCACKPRACHGDAIQQWVFRMLERCPPPYPL